MPKAVVAVVDEVDVDVVVDDLDCVVGAVEESISSSSDSLLLVDEFLASAEVVLVVLVAVLPG